MKPVLLLTAVLALGAGAAMADIYDEADISLTEYEVSGASLAEVQADMEANGPQGFWAYTTWNVTWDGNCQTTVVGEIIMPVLSDDADLSDDEVAEFERMAEALLDHELGHVRFGLNFAEDVVAQGCPADTGETLEYWLQAERDYDAETEHGLHQGVYLGNP